MLQLTLFGRFSLMGGDGVEVPVKSQKAKALLAYLALSPGMERSREEIMALLWSDRAEAQARASLRQVLFGLRQVLGQEGQEALRVSDHTITLDQSRIAVEEKTAGAELLSGFHLSDPAFEEWLRDERLRVEDVPSPTEDSGAETIVDKPSIAVLPFANLSGDPEQEYFSDGITQDITTELGRFESLVVISPNSSAAFKDHASNLDEIGEKLGAQFCVQGSVRKLGERVRFSPIA